MPDYGLARGPDDTRSHGEMMMEGVISEGKNPFKPCDCGGEFEESDSDSMVPKGICRFVCDNCGEVTYAWDDASTVSEQFKW